MAMLRMTVLVLLTQLAPACTSGYWQRQMATFDVSGGCERCASVAGSIESDEVSGAIEPRLYNLTNALVRTAGGDRLKAGAVQFNGATGAFESTDMKGYLRAHEVVVYLTFPIDVYAKRAESDRGGQLYIDSQVVRGETALRAHRIRAFSAK